MGRAPQSSRGGQVHQHQAEVGVLANFAAVIELQKLQTLKVEKNPFQPKLRKAFEVRDAELGLLGLSENDGELAVTAEVMKYLRELQPATTIDTFPKP